MLLVDYRDTLANIHPFRCPRVSACAGLPGLLTSLALCNDDVMPASSTRAGPNSAAALVGLVLSVGPLVVALSGVPAGRIADRFGAQRVTIVELIGIAAGSF